MRTRTIQLALAVTLLGGAIAYAADLGPFEGGTSSGSQALQGRAAKVKLHGSVGGLYPGARKRMRVRARNRYARPVTLRRVGTRVLDANPGCSREHLRVRRSKRPRRIGPHRAIRVRVRVRLRPTAPDACQNEIWPLRFRARVRSTR